MRRRLRPGAARRHSGDPRCAPVSASSSASPRSATREGGVALRTGGHQVRRGRDTQPARRRVWLREGGLALFSSSSFSFLSHLNAIIYVFFRSRPRRRRRRRLQPPRPFCFFSLSSASFAFSFPSQTSISASSASRGNREDTNRAEDLRREKTYKYGYRGTRLFDSQKDIRER